MLASQNTSARVGLLIPSSNTVMEVDFYRRLPAGATLHTGRMYMESTTPEGEGEMLDSYAMPAARDVGTARPDVVVFGCTSAGALRGNDYDRELCEQIQGETGAVVVSVIASVRSAIASRGAARVGVVTPYVEALNQKIKASLEADGLEVVAIHGLGITENFTIADVEPADIASFAAERLGALDIDLAFASCTNFRAMDAIPLIERRLGRPVVTSNQAALEATLEAIEAAPVPDSHVSDDDGALAVGDRGRRMGMGD
jgi:maleate isomerase